MAQRLMNLMRRPLAPPASYNPPAQYSPSSQSCVTGPTVCPMERPVSSGTARYCSTEQGKAWGRAT
jgi:hypothetical protein